MTNAEADDMMAVVAMISAREESARNEMLWIVSNRRFEEFSTNINGYCGLISGRLDNSFGVTPSQRFIGQDTAALNHLTNNLL